MFISFCISIIVYKIFLDIHKDHIVFLSEVSYNVIICKPHWIAFQNRLLGPYCIDLISKLGFSHLEVFQSLTFLLIIVQNFLFFSLIKRIGLSNEKSLLWITIYSIFFLFIQGKHFYIWDSIDGIIFTVFSFGIITKKPMSFFIYLFFVGILNRETAIFISFYIVIDSFYFNCGNKNKPIKLNSKLKMITGCILMVFGIVYTKFIRDFLFISTNTGSDDSSHQLIGNHIYIVENIRNIIVNNLTNMNILNSVFLIGTTWYLILFVRTYSDTQIKLFLIFIVIIGNIFIFGLINETRMFLLLIFPFIFLNISIHEKKI